MTSRCSFVESSLCARREREVLGVRRRDVEAQGGNVLEHGTDNDVHLEVDAARRDEVENVLDGARQLGEVKLRSRGDRSLEVLLDEVYTPASNALRATRSTSASVSARRKRKRLSSTTAVTSATDQEHPR